MFHKLTVKTRCRTELREITAQLKTLIAQSGVQEGCCWVYVPHTTAGLLVNENADPSVQKDVETALDTLIPWNGPYTHTEGNAAAHIKASLVGGSQTL
ncbi:MAG: YjbQ family protein, partial [Syntrophomonadaceae bacterium]|nr:YjbQ family protein [Syntrophomonadaceae bacterium]